MKPVFDPKHRGNCLHGIEVADVPVKSLVHILRLKGVATDLEIERLCSFQNLLCGCQSVENVQ
jgi:hypothetical protein